MVHGVVPDKRDLYSGFGDALARAFEFAATPAIFGLFGYWLDRRLGIVPVFTLALSLLVVVVMTWRLFQSYDARMKEEEQARRHTRSGK